MALTRLLFLRMQWLDERLRTNGTLTLRQLQDEFEISERTARRDIEFLRDRMLAPIEYDRKRKGYRYSVATFSLPAVSLTEGELFSLCLAEKALQQYRGSPLEPNLRSAFGKLCASLPEKISINVHALTDALSFDSGPLRAIDPEVFTTITRALKEDRRLSVRYYSQSHREETSRKIDPYHLLNHKGDWYLIAYCHLRGEARDFLVARMRTCQLTDETFAVPDSFDLDAYLHQSLGIIKGGRPQKVRILFDAAQAPYIRERRWHTSQQIREHHDGNLVIEFTVTGLEEVLRWVLQYGSHARVLSPKSLRDKVGAEAKKILEGYSHGQDMTG